MIEASADGGGAALLPSLQDEGANPADQPALLLELLVDIALGLVQAEADQRPFLRPDPEAARGVVLEVILQTPADLPFPFIQALRVYLRG